MSSNSPNPTACETKRYRTKGVALALVAWALAGCGGPVEISIDIDKSSCNTPCASGTPTLEFRVLREEFPFECIAAKAVRLSVNGETGVDLDVDAGGERVILETSFSCGSDCVLCWGGTEITVGGAADASASLSLKPATDCEPPSEAYTTADPCTGAAE